MQIANLNIHRLQLPDRAGDLQRQNATPALVKELGDNYDRYHTFLAAFVESIGGLPRASGFSSRDAYFEACELAQDAVRAEAILRICRDYRQRGGRLDAAISGQQPLYDDRYRLLAAP